MTQPLEGSASTFVWFKFSHWLHAIVRRYLGWKSGIKLEVESWQWLGICHRFFQLFQFSASFKPGMKGMINNTKSKIMSESVHVFLTFPCILLPSKPAGNHPIPAKVFQSWYTEHNLGLYKSRRIQRLLRARNSSAVVQPGTKLAGSAQAWLVRAWRLIRAHTSLWIFSCIFHALSLSMYSNGIPNSCIRSLAIDASCGVLDITLSQQRSFRLGIFSQIL